MKPKDELRALARAHLEALSHDSRMAFGESIAAAACSLPQMESASTILLYASLSTEVPTHPLADEAWKRGIRIAFPRAHPARRTMTLHLVNGHQELLAGGAYGIREPTAECPEIDLAEIDVAFLPGLAWDRAGNRLGRGAGYYDRLLALPDARAFRCGLFFAIQELPSIPSDPWDQPLQSLVTEKEILNFEF